MISYSSAIVHQVSPLYVAQLMKINLTEVFDALSCATNESWAKQSSLRFWATIYFCWINADMEFLLRCRCGRVTVAHLTTSLQPTDVKCVTRHEHQNGLLIVKSLSVQLILWRQFLSANNWDSSLSCLWKVTCIYSSDGWIYQKCLDTDIVFLIYRLSYWWQVKYK